MKERIFRLMSDLGSKAGEGRNTLISGVRLGEGVDLDVVLNAFMATDPHEVDAIDNFLES